MFCTISVPFFIIGDVIYEGKKKCAALGTAMYANTAYCFYYTYGVYIYTLIVDTTINEGQTFGST